MRKESRPWGNFKGCRFTVVLITYSEGFGGSLIIGSVHFKDLLATVFWGVIVKTRISARAKATHRHFDLKWVG